MDGLKILVARSVNRGLSPFIIEQVNSLKKQGTSIDMFDIKGKGKTGYLKNLFYLKKKLKSRPYQLIHAHGGLSGLLANLQRRVPVITTYHGTDVNLKSNVKYSKMAAWLSSYNILTNERLNNILKLKNHYSIIPCGVDLELFKPMDRDFCKQQMELLPEKDYILFSSAFDREEKNAELAQKAVDQIENTELIELKGYSREEVKLLINASELILMTSFYESAPLIIKEALACNRPVVSTDVGDVKQVLSNIRGSYLIDYDIEDVKQKCCCVLNTDKLYKSRESMKKYALSAISDQIKEVYLKVIDLVNH